MDIQEIKKILEDNLSISINVDERQYEEVSVVEVSILFDGQEITSDSFDIKTNY